ncbi:hypothetical protein A2U01_0050719 [Trifolium medium]|uniref:Uncharacterized protein n=1 Tax=Trifolium medium TaxID=97028 RepID=A0A392R110_9FABA|nr:hypothetical protein [Trifolium medium]
MQNKKQSSAKRRWDTGGAPLQILTPCKSPRATDFLMSVDKPSVTRMKR